MNFILFYFILFPKKEAKIEEMMFFEVCLPPFLERNLKKIARNNIKGCLNLNAWTIITN
jgi:hypothetical protein